uniref:Immunoglobulin like and fibronectin type III domain containing 1, tandem duplicate 3 n=1 Tax=Echeneis naucrates TaxID=173247 RepID=A0A665T0T6_ECHNA
MFKIRKSKDEEPTAPGQVRIKKRSRVPGVMITQYVEHLPGGMTTPDFNRKPIALTIQEGKLAIFRAIVVGKPAPTVRWLRNDGEIDEERYKTVYDASSGEHQLQMPDVSVDQADTYKCYAENEYGKAVVTATLNVIEGESHELPEDFKKTLKTAVDLEPKEVEKREIDDRFWELLMSIDKKDYESVCAEYGVTDFRWMLKKLNEKKLEREQQQEKVCLQFELICNLKPIELKSIDSAEFELEMSLRDPMSKIFLYKDGVMIPFDCDTEVKHGLKQVGRKFVFSINGLNAEDAGLYQVEVDGVKIFSTDFKLPPIDFLVKIQDVTAEEREDAVFDCVLSQPLKKITWMGKNITLEQGDKYDILVSEDMLIHTLVVKDCMPLDKGIYAAVAGLKSCSAWLIVEADNDPNSRGKKKTRKATRAGGGGANLQQIAQEQNAIVQRERGDMLAKAEPKASEEAVPKPKAKAKEKPKAKAKVKTEVKSKEEEAKGEAGEGSDKIEESVVFPVDPGVYFTGGLSDLTAIIGTDAELVCKLSKEECDALWYKDGKEITATDDICFVKDGMHRKLIIKNCKEDDAGKYRCEADGRKTEAVLNVADPPRINPDDLTEFAKPVIIKAGKDAAFKLSFVGREPMKIQWYNEGEELLEDTHIRIEKSSTHSRLLLTKCQRKTTGEIKIKIKNECGTIEAITQLIVLDKPTPPLGPVDTIESSSTCIEFKWRPPKNNGGSPITDYILERQQIGRNSWKKLGKIGPEPKYRDTDVDHGRKYCYHIMAETDQGISEMMETDDIQAGTKAYPGPPSTPKIISAFKDCINLAWSAPSNTGGTNLLGYNVERRKNGSNLWGLVNPADEPIREKKYAVKDVVEGIEYEFRVSAINISGAGEPSPPSEFVIARDPKMRPQFTDRKMKNFMVMRAGNSARVNFNFQASPIPTITWLKDGMPVGKHVTISNSDTSSQLMIPSSERHDTGIYTIIVKNIVGQDTSSVEIRITDDPKSPGPVELDENVSGTVTVSWTPSPDEKKDDRLHYMITKRDSVKRTWQTVADHLFNNKFTAINIMPGRQYQFRVYAKNDMGMSKPSESATGINANNSNFETPPSFSVPLKLRNSPESYECYMSCAVTGNPRPHVTWYRNNISLNTNTNYYITNTCGVCSMVILKVGAKDSGEYTVVAENPLGRVECSTKLVVKGKNAAVRSIFSSSGSLL